MRIVVNDIAASCGGAMTILKQFYNYIKDNDTDNEWVFLLGEDYLPETERIKIITFPEIKNSRIKKIIFDCFLGRKTVNNLHPDIVVSLQNIITFGVKAPQAVYVHQSIPFQTIKNFSFFKSDERSIAIIQHFIGFFIKRSIKKADVVFVQTDSMKKAVSELTRTDSTKIHTVFPDVELYRPNQEKFISNRFFYPTSDAKYKNIDLIIKACDSLVKNGFNDFEVRLTLPENALCHPNIKCIGRLNREQMQEEYQSGTLLFPSYIETVGLPMLEAKSCETRIFASDMPFSHECLDGYGNACFFDVFDSNQLAALIKSGLNSKNILQIKNNQKRNSDWSKMLDIIVALRGE